nr:MarR family transcriptional regulator [uncultured Agathobaculum sp.]
MRTTDELLSCYYQSWLGLDAVYEKWAARRGVTSNVLNILILLHEQAAPIPQAELCRCLHLSKQTVASVIDSLEKRGIAARRVSEGDRRSRVVMLTGTGDEAARKLSEALRQFERRALSMLTPAQQQALVDTTQKLCQSMEQALAQEME